MPELQSAVSTPWAPATPVQAAVAAPWNSATRVQSIGSTYTPPARPAGASDIAGGSLTSLAEILPAASYRSTATAVMRNVRLLSDPLLYFSAPLKVNAADIRPSPATPNLYGSPTFDGDGVTCTPGALVYYQVEPLENRKLFASEYTEGIEYRVRVRNTTVVPPGYNTDAAYIFTIYGFAQKIGFLMKAAALYVHDYAADIRAFQLPLGALPLDCVLSVAYPAGSGQAQLKINGAVVYTSPGTSRIDSGITLGLQSATEVINSLKFSDLRLERTPVLTDGLALEDGEIVPAISGSIDLPDGSALWRMSSTIPRASYDSMRAGEQPPLVSLLIGGKTWLFAVDEMTAPRAFAATDVTIRGVSLAALADAPYELARQWTSDAPTTAAQIATLAQTFTGLEVSWQLPDWLVPAAAWSFSGTPWGAVLAVAAPVQAVVEAAKADLAVKVTSRYPIMPNEWATTPPDAQVPWVAVESENVTANDRPAYNGVYVAGPAETIASVRLEGTSGAEQAPLVTHELMTDLAAQVELGRTILAASGGAQNVTRTLQVLTGAGEPGVIERGALVRWVDPTDTWVGMVRAVRIDWQFGQVRQTLTCERRTSFLAGTFTP